jgi:hypothetical protein
MRRLIVPIVVLAVATLLAGPAIAAGNAFHFSSKGLGAEGGWTSVSGSGTNATFTDTFIFASQDIVSFDGETFSDPFVFVDRFTFKFDRKGNFVFVSDTFGFASGSAVNLSVDSKLRSASVSATVDLETCTERSCRADGTAEIAASWTGTGDVIRVVDNFKVGSKTFTETGHFKGTFRNADATATFDGADVGDQFFADIFDTSFRDTFVCHGC